MFPLGILASLLSFVHPLISCKVSICKSDSNNCMTWLDVLDWHSVCCALRRYHLITYHRISNNYTALVAWFHRKLSLSLMYIELHQNNWSHLGLNSILQSSCIYDSLFLVVIAKQCVLHMGNPSYGLTILSFVYGAMQSDVHEDELYIAVLNFHEYVIWLHDLFCTYIR